MSARTRLGAGSTRHWRIEPRANNHASAPLAFEKKPEPWRARKILFVNQYYWPDHASTAQHLTDLAESLAQQGHECHILCGRGAYKAGGPKLPAFESHNGVFIHRVKATSFGRKSTLGRMTDYLSFYARAVLKCLFLPRFDVVVTLTTPPLIALIGTLLRRFKGSRHVYWSMDLHPDAGLALGKLSHRNPAIAALERLSRVLYRRADRVVVLGPYMADRILRKGVRPNRIETIPVWSRKDEVYPLPREGHPLRQSMGLDNHFVVLYSGNLGLAHSFDELIEAARRLKGRSDIVFLVVGGGPRLGEVEEAKRRHGLDNVRLHDYFPRDQLHASLSLADAHLISMRPEMTGLVVPGKLYGSMASGRPALFVGPDHCESADAVREADCGITIRTGDPDALVAAIEELASKPDLVQALGERGQQAFLEQYERELCCTLWSRMLDDLFGVLPRQPNSKQTTAGRIRPTIRAT